MQSWEEADISERKLEWKMNIWIIKYTRAGDEFGEILQ